MKKRSIALALALLLALSLCMGAAAAEPEEPGEPVPTNLGAYVAGSELDLLVLTSELATAERLDETQTLPVGLELITELREGMAWHYLRGKPMLAGVYRFTLGLKDMEGALIHEELYELTLNPATPVVVTGANVVCSQGEDARISVSATTSDAGTLSYQWFYSGEAAGLSGSPIDYGTEASLGVSTEVPGTSWYYCTVMNVNNGMSVSVLSEPISVQVDAASIVSLSIHTQPAKQSYTVGETIDTAGLSLIAHWSNGVDETVTSGFTVSPTKLETAGTQTVTVTYQGVSTTFPVLVAEVEEKVESIFLVSTPSKMDYEPGEWLDTTGLRLRVQTNKDSYEVTTGFVCSPWVFQKEGSQIVTVSYGGKTTEFTVNVRSAEEKVESIAVLQKPEKLNYTVGESFDAKGLQLRVFTNHGERAVSEGFTWTPGSFTAAGAQTVTISYQGQTCSLTVEVAEKVEETEAPTPSPAPTAAPMHEPETRPSRSGSRWIFTVLIVLLVLTALVLILYILVAKKGGWNAFVESLRKKEVEEPDDEDAPDREE